MKTKRNEASVLERHVDGLPTIQLRIEPWRAVVLLGHLSRSVRNSQGPREVIEIGREIVDRLIAGLSQGQPEIEAILRRSNSTEGARRCRECGCTEADCSECVERTGEPCFWIEVDLCSACEAAEADAAVQAAGEELLAGFGEEVEDE